MTKLAIQLIVETHDRFAVDVIEFESDSDDPKSIKKAAQAVVEHSARFDADTHRFRVRVDPEGLFLAETVDVDLEPGKPKGCRKERNCVPFAKASEVGLTNGGKGAYPVDLGAYVLALRVIAQASAKASAKEAAMAWARESCEPAIKAEPKPVEAFPGREERSRAAALPAAERAWVEETVQGVAGIIGEVAAGKDVYINEGEFIEIAAEVEERIDPALAAVLLDEVGERFQRRPRVVWLNITDSTTEWALTEAERRASEAAEDGPTEALLARIKAAIRRTWGAIAHDILTAAGADTLPIEDVVEVTLDADHVHTFGGDREAAKALDLFDFEKQNELATAALS